MFKKRPRSSVKEVKLEDISEHLIPLYNTAPCAFVLHNLFSPMECTQLIRLAEHDGFDSATVEGPEGNQIIRKDIRKCGRCIIDDAKLADSIFERILNAIRGTKFEEKVMHAPWVVLSNNEEGEPNNNEETYRITAVGLNERMRFLKYTKGHFFAPHQDIRFTRGSEFGERAGETSQITVQIYLNDKFKGGSTRFISGIRYYDVQPRIGSALVFEHDLLHEGRMVTKGQKYSVRTDIMYNNPKKQIILSSPLRLVEDVSTIAAPQDVAQECAQDSNNGGYDEFLNVLERTSIEDKHAT
ncbi:hypothetical protein ACHAWC_009819 [Mediolabrus comicus]